MPSTFRWVDFADEDRQRMLDVIHLFREREARDELGIGTIRDAFSDYFFPGTSTVQTRAKYMLFVPQIYRGLERKRASSAQIATKARRMETKLMRALIAGGESEGVLGRVAGQHLQRLPSNIYWSGFGEWGIRLFPGSQSQYHHYLDAFHRLRASEIVDDDKEPLAVSGRHNWDPALPAPPDDWMEITQFNLGAEEALYLQECILMRHPATLLAKLVQDDRFHQADFPWQHPIVGTLPGTLQDIIWHARSFSETILGAALLYNFMLSLARNNDEWIANYRERLNEWRALIGTRWPDLQAWFAQTDRFWRLPAIRLARIPYQTRAFVSRWLHMLFQAVGPERIANSSSARELIREREVQLKRNRARFENPRALELWRGASGDRQLDYRWGNVSVIQADILSGLRAKEDIHA